MSYIVNLCLKDRAVVVVGAGLVASRKVRDLLEAGAEVTVVAPSVCPELEVLAGASRIRLLRRPYSDGDVRQAFLAIAATNDEELNGSISRDAMAAGALVNVVDQPALCTFTLPAVVRRGDLALAVSTEGQCPALASLLREELSARYGPKYAEVVRIFGEVRRELIARGCNSAGIRRTFRLLYEADAVNMILRGDLLVLASVIKDILTPTPPRQPASEPAP